MKNNLWPSGWGPTQLEKNQWKILTKNVTESCVTILDFDENIETWNNLEIEKIYELEQKCWAPWLEASYSSLKWRAKIFPLGQIALISKEQTWNAIAASLSLNQIHWNGEKDSLPSWDDVAWDPTTYENTYDPNGNALVLMSMNVNEKYHWSHSPLLSSAKKLAKNKNLPYVIWSFRPNKFWAYITTLFEQYGSEYFLWIDLEKLFAEYIEKECNGKPIDQWIWILKKKYGMKPLKIDTNAMVVKVTIEEFHKYKKIDEQKEIYWYNIKDNIWSSGQTGFWYIYGDYAIYKESNVWWLIPNE